MARSAGWRTSKSSGLLCARDVWHLYFIGVLANQQGRGCGSAILRACLKHVEQTLRSQGERILIIETSGLDGFELTRKFYDQHGYTVEARIRDYYQEGEYKVVFWKKLGTRSYPQASPKHQTPPPSGNRASGPQP